MAASSDQVVPCLATAAINYSFIPVFILFYRNRGLHPIRGRHWELVLLQVAMLIAACGFSTVNSCLAHSNCIFSSLGTSFILFSLAIYFTRLVHLFFAYEITEHLKENKDSWILRHRWVLGDKFTFLALGSYAIYLLGFMGIGMGIATDYESCRARGSFLTVFFNLNGLIGLIACAVVFLKIHRHRADALNIKREHQFVIISSFIALFVGIGFVLFEFTIGYCPLTNLFFASIYFWIAFWPYMLTKRERIGNKRASKFRARDLKWVLSDPEAVKSFRDYLELEFSVENLLFYQEVEKFRITPISPELKIIARQIYETYIKVNASRQVNLPFTVQRSLESELLTLQSSEEIPETIQTMFDAAQREIFHLMVSDSFVRFQRVQAGVNWVEESSPGTGSQELSSFIGSSRTDVGLPQVDTELGLSFGGDGSATPSEPLGTPSSPSPAAEDDTLQRSSQLLLNNNQVESP